MMEHNTDRLFWTLTSIIVGALLLTISVKAFPGVANTVIQPISGITKQADTSTKTADQAYNDATEDQAKADAVEASTLNLRVAPNNDGTGNLNGPVNGKISGSLNIPEYVKVNGQLIKITSIGYQSFTNNQITSVTIPDSVKLIDFDAFYGNQLTSVTIPKNVGYIGAWAFTNNQLTSVALPNSVNNIGDHAFYSNHIANINVPNQHVYQSINSAQLFDPNVTATNNPANY